MNLLEVKGVSFAYAQNSVLENITFHMGAGEVFCLIGPNGSGKTTLLDCIMGILPLKQGNIFLNGNNIIGLKAKQIAQIVSYVPQIHKKTFPYTVEEIVLMGRASHIGMFNSPNNNDILIAQEAIESVGITHLLKRPYTELSGGEGQLVMIARALAQKPKIMILDEPTTYLDFQNSLIILDIIRKLIKKKNLSVILATHYLNHAFYFENNGLSTLTAILNQKNFVVLGRPSEILTRQNIDKFFNIESRIIEYNSDEKKKQKYIIPIRLLKKEGKDVV